jgi:hypothetical protein
VRSADRHTRYGDPNRNDSHADAHNTLKQNTLISFVDSFVDLTFVLDLHFSNHLRNQGGCLAFAGKRTRAVAPGGFERLLAKESTDCYESTRDLYRELKQMRERYSEGARLKMAPAAGTLTEAGVFGYLGAVKGVVYNRSPHHRRAGVPQHQAAKGSEGQPCD